MRTLKPQSELPRGARICLLSADLAVDVTVLCSAADQLTHDVFRSSMGRETD
jgi:hypothetical protein